MLKEPSCQDETFKIALNECKIMNELSQVSCPYFTRMFDSNIPRLNNIGLLTLETRCFIVIELAPNGTLFDFVREKPLTEEVARYYFVQLIKGLEAMHKAGYCHKDIKLDNILLDSNFVLKISDFGLSQPLKNKQDGYMLTDICGTKGYMAPELLKKKPHKGVKVDVFAAGVCLF